MRYLRRARGLLVLMGTIGSVSVALMSSAQEPSSRPIRVAPDERAPCVLKCVELCKLPEDITSVALSPDSNRLVVCGFKKSVWMWRLSGESISETIELPKHSPYVWRSGFSSDGRLLCLVERGSHTVRLWDVTSDVPKEIVVPSKHDDSVWTFSFSPDCKRIATAGSRDHTARVWEIANEKAVEGSVLRGSRLPLWDVVPSRLSGRGVIVDDVAFVPKSSLVVTGERVITEEEEYRLVVWELEGKKAQKK